MRNQGLKENGAGRCLKKRKEKRERGADRECYAVMNMVKCEGDWRNYVVGNEWTCLTWHCEKRVVIERAGKAVKENRGRKNPWI
jgi:hypothetical protein